MSLGKEDVPVKILWVITQQSMKHVHKGNGQGRQVHHNMSIINFTVITAPDVKETGLDLSPDELPRVFVETLNISGAFLV